MNFCKFLNMAFRSLGRISTNFFIVVSQETVNLLPVARFSSSRLVRMRISSTLFESDTFKNEAESLAEKKRKTSRKVIDVRFDDDDDAILKTLSKEFMIFKMYNQCKINVYSMGIQSQKPDKERLI